MMWYNLNLVVKRVFDIVSSFCAIVVLTPLWIVVGIWIKLDSEGPILFKQGRRTKDGRVFKMWKYRSMVVNAENIGSGLFSYDNDPRITKSGAILRKTSIDELPQLFNVLKGDMSIVGPRPHMLHHTEMYGKLIDDYMVRLFCKPGVTGLAQVTGFRGETKELWQMEGRVKRDIYYVEHWSFWLDLKIIAMTFISIFKHDKNAF